MKFESIETQRLILRILPEKDYKRIFGLTDPEIMALLNIDSPEKLETQKEKQKKGLSTYNKSFVIFQILDRQTGNIIGGCSYHTWYLDHGRAEIGYALEQESDKGKGIMSEAMEAIIAYGFREMKLSRIEAFIGSGNVASLKLAAKFGFKEEGVLRNHYFKDGKLQDSVVFGLLKEEYFGDL